MFCCRPPINPCLCAPIMWGCHVPIAHVTYAQPIVHPTNFIENHTYCTTIVPHVYPTHVNTVHHNMIQHQVSHPCTQTQCNVVEELGCAPVCNMQGYGTAWHNMQGTSISDYSMPEQNMGLTNMWNSNTPPTFQGQPLKYQYGM